MLSDFAEVEIRAAGLFAEGSDYDGEIGKAVMELVRVFSSQGHSGASAHMTLDIFNKVARYQSLTPLKHPKTTGEYILVDERMAGKHMLQSTRKYSMFSDDDGLTWYDIDKRVPWYMRWIGVKKMPVKF